MYDKHHKSPMQCFAERNQIDSDVADDVKYDNESGGNTCFPVEARFHIFGNG